MSWKVLLERGKEIERKEDGKGLRTPRKRGVLILWAIASVAAILLIGSYAWANKSVALVVDGKETTVQTYSRTVGGVLKAQNVTLLEKDEVNPPLDTPLKKGMVVTVDRAVDVAITVDGCELPARTRGQTVKDILGEYGINLGPEDEVTPAKETPVTANMKVNVARVRTDSEVNEASIDFATKKQYTTKLPQGSTRVAREGQEGTERRTWQITYRDGKEVNRQLASREVVSSPVDKVVMVGSGMEISRGGENIRYSDVIDMTASAYSHTGNNTSSGIYPHYGVVAVDPTRIPMGTRLYVEGYGYATALDKGGAIKGNRIDLFFESESEAMSWGLRRAKVYILD